MPRRLFKTSLFLLSKSFLFVVSVVEDWSLWTPQSLIELLVRSGDAPQAIDGAECPGDVKQ